MLLKGGVATPSTPPLDPPLKKYPLQRSIDKQRAVSKINYYDNDVTHTSISIEIYFIGWFQQVTVQVE